MNAKLTETQKMIGLKPIVCTHTGKRIVAESSSQFILPDGQVTWFHCEACQGWHVIVDNKPRNNPETLIK